MSFETERYPCRECEFHQPAVTLHGGYDGRWEKGIRFRQAESSLSRVIIVRRAESKVASRVLIMPSCHDLELI